MLETLRIDVTAVAAGSVAGEDEPAVIVLLLRLGKGDHEGGQAAGDGPVGKAEAGAVLDLLADARSIGRQQAIEVLVALEQQHLAIPEPALHPETDLVQVPPKRGVGTATLAQNRDPGQVSHIGTGRTGSTETGRTCAGGP